MKQLDLAVYRLFCGLAAQVVDYDEIKKKLSHAKGAVLYNKKPFPEYIYEDIAYFFKVELSGNTSLKYLLDLKISNN